MTTHAHDLPHAGRAPSVDADEVARFAALAERWWDADGPLAPLHRLNPVRLAFVRDTACAHFRRDARASAPLAGLDLVDVGCGGGLLSEPLARLGAHVTGIDAAAENIAAAAAHAAATGVEVAYRATTAEAVAATGATYDVVVSMEVVEHVADLDAFLGALARLVRPRGLLFLATINRTARAFAEAIVGAEYVLGWLPRGTHDWRRFVRPSELARPLRSGGLEVVATTGVRYRPWRDAWVLDRDLAVNYMLCATRPA